MQANIKKLKILREETGVSFALCKKALEESSNDLPKAKKFLNEWGAEKVTSKATKSTTQGALFSYIHHTKKIGTLLELLCETDFVSANADFQKLGTELAMQVASTNPKTIEKLIDEEYIRDPSKKISSLIRDAVLKFGENIRVGRFIRFVLGEV